MLRAGLSNAVRIDAKRSTQRGYDKTFVSCLGLGQIVSWGTLYYSYPLIAEAMSQELSLSKSEVYGAATVGLLASAFFAYPIGKAIDRGRGRGVMVAGSLFAGLLMLGWSHISVVWLLYAIVLLLGVAQSMTLYEAAFAVVAASTSPNHISDSIMRLTLWGGFASTVFVPFAELLIQKLGWRDALAVSGMFNFAVAGLYYLTIPKAEAEFTTTTPGARSFELVQRQSIKLAFSSEALWALLISFALYSLVFSGLTFHIYPLFASRELSSSMIAAGIALLGPAQVLGRVLFWKFSNRISIAQSGRYVLLAFPASVLAVIFLGPLSSLFTFVIVYGIANGIMTIIRGTAVPEILTTRSYGSINGLISVPATICKALGPFAVAYAFQLRGSYDAAIIAVLFATVLILISYWYATAKAGTVSRSVRSSGVTP